LSSQLVCEADIRRKEDVEWRRLSDSRVGHADFIPATRRFERGDDFIHGKLEIGPTAATVIISAARAGVDETKQASTPTAKEQKSKRSNGLQSRRSM
jgi:hypothetical protein